MESLTKFVNVFRNKRGFGLVEVLASMAILALLFTAVGMLQISNHTATVRIMARNEATQIAQNIIDSLRAVGVNSVHQVDSMPVLGRVSGSGTSATQRMYTARIDVTDYIHLEGAGANQAIHIMAKKVEVAVEWTIMGGMHSIVLSSVVE